MTRVVFVHGAGGGPELWVAVARKLHDVECDCLALPGHRDGGPGRASLESYAAWLAERLPGPSIVAGSSMGGALALLLALQRPELVAGLVLVGTGARLRVSPRLLASVRDDEDYAERLARLELGAHADPRAVAKSAALIQRVPREVTLADLHACDGFDVRDRLHEIAAPALVIHGEQDRMTPVEGARELAEGLPNAKLVLLPRSGHLPMVDQPRTVAQTIEPFMRSI